MGILQTSAYKLFNRLCFDLLSWVTLLTLVDKKNILPKKNILLFGSLEFQRLIMIVCEDYFNVFGNTLTENATALKTFDLNVDLPV